MASITQTRKIAGLIERMSRLLTSDAHAEGLLPVHWETLRYLSSANRFSRTLAGLTAFLGSTKGTVSQTLKGLENKGLIEKETFAKDRRNKRIAITPLGRKKLKHDPLALWGSAIESLSNDETKGLEESLSLILRTRLEEREQRLFGQCRDCHYFIPKHAEGGPHYCDLLKVKLIKEDANKICVEQEPRRQA